jgi:hypothetical protein
MGIGRLLGNPVACLQRDEKPLELKPSG